jgi:preprotein translocase subunit SecD
MTLTQRTVFSLSIILLSTIYIIPWDKLGVDIPALSKPYTLGLDLQGGIELDYKVDMDIARSQSG